MNASDPLCTLVDTLRAGDERSALGAFVELRAALRPRLVEIASYLLSSDPDAGDLVEDLFADLWSKRADLTILANPRAYFERAMEHRALNWLRSEARRRRHEAEWVEDGVMRASATHRTAAGDVAIDADADKRLEAAEIRAALLAVMRELPERQLQVFQRRFDGMSFAGIAVDLGMREQTARNHFGRAMQALGARFPWLRSSRASSGPVLGIDGKKRRRA